MSTKQEQVKLEDQEVENLLLIQKRKAVLREEMANIGLLKLSIEDREEKAKLFRLETLKAEAETGKALQEKYGKGRLDLDQKLFIPAE